LLFLLLPPHPTSTLFPYTTLFRSSSVLNLCNLLSCQVQGSLDGPVGQTFLVTSTNNLLANLVNGTLTLTESLLGIVSVEADSLRSEEHTSELQSRENLVCRLLLEK